MAKLIKEQKIEIYERRLNDETIKSLTLNFNINIHNIEYLIKLVDRHGYSIKNRYYSKEFKELTIKRILTNNESLLSITIDIGLSSIGILINWIKKYKENCSNVIEKKKGRKSKTMTKIKKNNKPRTSEEKIKDLEKKFCI